MAAILQVIRIESELAWVEVKQTNKTIMAMYESDSGIGLSYYTALKVEEFYASNMILKNIAPRAGEAVQTFKIIGCSCRGHWFSLQQTHDNFQLSVTPVPEYLMPSFGLCGHQAFTWWADIHIGKTPIHRWTCKREEKIKTYVFYCVPTNKILTILLTGYVAHILQKKPIFMDIKRTCVKAWALQLSL